MDLEWRETLTGKGRGRSGMRRDTRGDVETSWEGGGGAE